MTIKITDLTVKTLPAPATGSKVYYSDDVAGFGVRVTAAGVKAFVLNYRTKSGGQERRYTIGRYPSWQVRAARDKAKELRREVDNGGDPMGNLTAERQAPTVAQLAERFVAEHVTAKCRPGTAKAYRSHLRNYILPALGNMKVHDVKFSDVDRLHQRVTKEAGPYAGNRVKQTASKMFSLAVRWEYRETNPCAGVSGNREEKRRRYLEGDELPRLLQAMAAYPNQSFIRIVRVTMLTGARIGEVVSMRWEHLNLAAGTWSKPASTTKQKTAHSVPPSAPARALLAEIEGKQQKDGTKGTFVFPGRNSRSGHYADPNTEWAKLRKAAGMPDLRLHDLRHSFASALASGGVPLATISELLGHSNIVQTRRYSHIYLDAARSAAERIGAIVSCGETSFLIRTPCKPEKSATSRQPRCAEVAPRCSS